MHINAFSEEEREGGGGEKESEMESPSFPLMVAAHGRYTAITRRCIDPAARSPTVRRIPRWSNPLSLSFSRSFSVTPQQNTLSFEKEKKG